MYLNKNQKGFGYYSVVSKNGKGEETPHKQYINWNFKKGTEPTQYQLNEKGSYEAELYLIDKNGDSRKVFPYIDEYNGNASIRFRVLGVESDEDYDKRMEQTITREQGLNGGEINIDQEELPFY